jgi:O-antigen/teichoic acid export membrane protein
VDKKLFDRFAKGVAATSIGTFSQMILGFVGLMVVVRYVPKDEFGIFILIQAIAIFFEVLSNLALEGISVPWFITNADEGKKPEVVNVLISYFFLVCIAVSLLIFLCEPVINYFIESKQPLIYVSLFFLLNSHYNFFLRILQGLHQYKKIAITQIFSGVIRLILIVILLVFYRMNLIGLLYAFILSLLFSVIFQYIVIPIKKKFIIKRSIIRDLFKFGLPLAVNNIISFFATKIDRFMISAFNTSIGVAYFEVASRIPDNTHRMYSSFQTVFFPNISELFAKKNYIEAEKVINNSLRLISFATLFMTLIATLFKEEIITIMFSEQYIDCANALSVLMLSLCIALIGNIIGSSLVALGQSDKPLKINIMWASTNAVGNFLLIPIYGFMGAVYATLISIVVTHPISLWFLMKSGLKIQVSQYLKPLAIFLMCEVLYLVIPGDIFVVKVTLIALFLVSSFFFSIVRKKDVLRFMTRDSGIP